LLLVKFDDGTIVADSLHSNVLLSRSDESLKVGDIGLIEVSTFHAFQNAVDFSKTWKKGEAEDAFREIIESPDDGHLATAYPIPMIPAEYDPTYQPKFLVIHSIDRSVFYVVDFIKRSIDEDIRHICLLSGGLAVFGMVLVISIVWFVSRKLTQPLLLMERVAWRIVNHADERVGDALKMGSTNDDDEKTPRKTRRGWCSPKTEVNDLVAEFKTMIKGFSGEGASKVANSAMHEILNDLTWHSDFQQLYSSRQRRSIRSCSVASNATTEEDTSRADAPSPGILVRPLNDKDKKEGEEEALSLIVPAPLKRNQSHIICAPHNLSVGDAGEDQGLRPTQIQRSPLFWWVVVLIVIPLLFLICLTCAIVQDHIGTTIPSWVNQADEASHGLAMKSLNLTAASKAALMNSVVFEAIRDLHLMTRVAGWLFFGGIEQSSAFTEMVTAAEDCKLYPKNACPFYNSSLASCPCEWNDLNGKNCIDYNVTESRNLQKQFWALQSQDADSTTGNRKNSSSFYNVPSIGSSPATTEWWTNVSELPGFEIGRQASGYSTSYIRLRVVSAMAVVVFPVFNYANNLGRKNRKLGLFTGFEDDGLITGFHGCHHPHANYALWNSSDTNGVDLALCPVGKFGFDPRCMDWYKSGRDEYFESKSPVHVTGTYKFAADNNIATSATAPIANPRSKEYVGQVLIDFYPEGIKSGLEQLSSLKLSSITPIMITANVDVTGGDTVIGPNMSTGGESAPIIDLLFEYDGPGSSYRMEFEKTCLAAMRNGTSGLKEFKRTTPNGEENFVIAYAPVYERVLLPVSPDDFSRGVKVTEVLLYSVGIIRNAQARHLPFHAIENDLFNRLNGIRTSYVFVTVLVALLFTALTCVVS